MRATVCQTGDRREQKQRAKFVRRQVHRFTKRDGTRAESEVVQRFKVCRARNKSEVKTDRIVGERFAKIPAGC
jgi:hypothetical protein